MDEKIDLIKKIFTEDFTEEDIGEIDKTPAREFVKMGRCYGGVYKGRKYMYSYHLIQSLSLEKLESFIRGQIGTIV